MSTKTLRCAIYTRKSSDEGLDQSFNSLDAQREAGEAYVRSQAHEGWKLLPTRYDDGGFSGGSMERPGLQQLLTDVAAGLVDVVVVYKIDRLTRSLADFARIVEAFDRREVSFVSVTQAFNTTSSMGRLTLNVLLSFAQFEREVTGERIRDKIAASKARGMWMGGVPPLGYDLPEAGSRKLQVNTAEAATVRHIFARYVELGSVHALQRELGACAIVSKRYRTQRGREVGGTPFSRGALFHLLRNRLYLGQIVHRGAVYDGEHDAIVDVELFDAVQRSLDANARRHGARGEQRMVRAPLTGKLFDAAGEPMSLTFSRGRSGKTYRYYVSASLQQGGSVGPDHTVRRLAAREIETLLEGCIGRWLPTCSESLALVETVRLIADGLLVTITGDRAADIITAHLVRGETILRATRQRTIVQLDIALPLRGGRRMVVAGDRSQARIDPVLVAALRKAHRFIRRDRSGLPLVDEAPRTAYERRILRLAFLAPELQRDILAGRQPAALNLENFLGCEVPLAWNKQREALGWPRI
jgi:DNA invertase Pin-like site-specific DNA recombinase